MHNIDQIIRAIECIADVALLGCLAYRKLVGRFTLFFAYILCLIFGLLVAMCLRENTIQFYVAYWIILALTSLLSLTVIIAIFWPAVELIQHRLGLPGFILPLALLALIDFSFWRTLHHMFSRDWIGQSASLVYSFDLAVSVINIIIFLMSLWLRPKYRKIWEAYNFYVISGFAVISLNTLLAYVMRLGFGTTFELAFRYLPFLTSTGVTLAWIYIFSRPEPEDEDGSKSTDPKQFDDLLREGNEIFDEIDRIFRRRPMRCDIA
jgi:hypothetical protein